MLVRDPRAMIESRKNIAMMDGLWKRDQVAMVDQLGRECEKFQKNYKIQQDYKGIMRIVRYEDMAKDPERITNEIYKFVNLEQTAEISKFLKISTQNDDSGKNYRKGEEFLQVYSTSRKSAENLNKWRIKMDYILIRKVQEKCKGMMKTFGYTIFNSQEDVRNISKTYF